MVFIFFCLLTQYTDLNVLILFIFFISASKNPFHNPFLLYLSHFAVQLALYAKQQK